MDKSTDISTQIDVLLSELDELQKKYNQAIREDSFLSVKKEIRVKTKEIQRHLTELSDKLGAHLD